MQDLRDSLLQGKPGCINFFDINNPALTEDFRNAIKSNRDYKRWMSYGYDIVKFNDIAQRIFTYDNLKQLIVNLGDMDFLKEPFKSYKNRIIEKEQTFPMPVKYITAFYKYIYNEQKLPTEEEFWRYWFKLNADFMKKQCNVEWVNNLPLTAAARMIYQRAENKVKHRAFFDLPKDKMYITAGELVKLAAEYRCKKSYCGFIRELYTLSTLTIPYGNRDKSFLEPYTVWIDPTLDIVLKTDGLIIGPGTDYKIAALAIYLDSEEARDNAKRKVTDYYIGDSEVIETYKDNIAYLCSAPVSQKGGCQVTVPTDEEVLLYRRTLAKERLAIRTPGVYHWNNPEYV